ncbi:MAG: FAD-binding oxidoreductase [Candidatus Limnocylindrales bacterium]
MTTALTPDLDALRSTIRGTVLTPGDDRYDAVRQLFLASYDRHPAAIVEVADAADAATAVVFARDSGLPLAVRSGGHGAGGFASTDGGLVIDVRQLRAIDIDTQGRTVWAGAGVTAGELTTATVEHGLATGFGDTGSVGISGITLGGGVGFLSRKHGMTIDNLLGVELVTADGQVLEADADHHPDLFWAVRGGGGNFGVVTRLRYRLADVHEFTGGMLMLPATPATVTGFIDLAEAAPDGLSTILNVMPCPPMPFLPEEHHGKLVLLAMLAWAGPADEGARVLAPFRSLAEPLVDMVAEQPYTGMYPPEEGAAEYRPMAVQRTLFLDHVDEAMAGRILERLADSDAPMRAVQLRVLGGAIARVPRDATAYAHRSRRIMGVVVSFHGPDDLARREQWVTSLADGLRQGDAGAYVNFLMDQGPDGVHEAYPPDTYRRLASIKASWDPGNLFRSNQNIPPAAG